MLTEHGALGTYSAYSGAAYALAALGVLLMSTSPPSLIMSGALLTLAVGTTAFHIIGSNTWGQDLDRAGMNATFATLAMTAIGSPWWLTLPAAVAAGVVVEFMMDHPNRVFVGSLYAIAAIAVAAAGALATACWSVAFMGAAYYIWHQRTDEAHAIWHVLTAIGIWLLWTAVP